jgi:hypothetical protein
MNQNRAPTVRAITQFGCLVLMGPALLANAQESKPADSGAGAQMHVVPYCIEPMDSMQEKIRGLIEAQFRCEAGTHLKRDSRPVIVMPSGEEGRPFVLRFQPPEKANAWYVRGFAVEPQK